MEFGVRGAKVYFVGPYSTVTVAGSGALHAIIIADDDEGKGAFVPEGSSPSVTVLLLAVAIIDAVLAPDGAREWDTNAKRGFLKSAGVPGRVSVGVVERSGV